MQSNPSSEFLSLNLWVHDERYSKYDVVINPEWFPDITAGDLVEIWSPATRSRPVSENKPIRDFDAKHHAVEFTSAQNAPASLEDRLVLQVDVIDGELSGKQPQLQISVAQHIATQFQLIPRTNISIRKVSNSFANGKCIAY